MLIHLIIPYKFSSNLNNKGEIAGYLVYRLVEPFEQYNGKYLFVYVISEDPSDILFGDLNQSHYMVQIFYFKGSIPPTQELKVNLYYALSNCLNIISDHMTFWNFLKVFRFLQIFITKDSYVEQFNKKLREFAFDSLELNENKKLKIEMFGKRNTIIFMLYFNFYSWAIFDKQKVDEINKEDFLIFTMTNLEKYSENEDEYYKMYYNSLRKLEQPDIQSIIWNLLSHPYLKNNDQSPLQLNSFLIAFK